MDFERYLAKSIEFFHISVMHVHDRPKLSESGEFLGKERLWTLFKAIEKRYSRPILILDTDGIVNPANLNLALTIEDDPEIIMEWLDEVPYLSLIHI